MVSQLLILLGDPHSNNWLIYSGFETRTLLNFAIDSALLWVTSIYSSSFFICICSLASDIGISLSFEASFICSILLSSSKCTTLPSGSIAFNYSFFSFWLCYSNSAVILASFYSFITASTIRSISWPSIFSAMNRSRPYLIYDPNNSVNWIVIFFRFSSFCSFDFCFGSSSVTMIVIPFVIDRSFNVIFSPLRNCPRTSNLMLELGGLMANEICSRRCSSRHFSDSFKSILLGAIASLH